MKKIFESKLNIILVSCLAALLLIVGISTAVDQFREPEEIEEFTVATSAIAKSSETTEVRVNEVKVDGKNSMHDKIREEKKLLDVKQDPTEPETEKKAKTEEAAKAETENETETGTEEETVPEEERVYATAAPVAQKASYDAQWNAGYLIAIDNPDASYSCPHFELSDDNRDLLERLCMGEYGEAGFTGAALIAQSVKNAMQVYGYTEVSDIITNLRYTGRTDRAATTAVKKAVVYVFDMDKDAVQHRILYMYNPELLSSRFSAFHESRKYICNYGPVRFFDK